MLYIFQNFDPKRIKNSDNKLNKQKKTYVT